MKLTLEEKLEMYKEHVVDKKTLSHVSERYGNYKRDTKLITVSRVKKGESLRNVSLVTGYSRL